MKTLFALLISCLTISAATTYPVITDSANRTFPGGVTNVFFLNSNVVTTGTMRATGALTLTNASNVFKGDGSGLTGISAGISTSGGSATNLSVYSSGTTNWPLRVTGTNTTRAAYVDKDGFFNLLRGDGLASYGFLGASTVGGSVRGMMIGAAAGGGPGADFWIYGDGGVGIQAINYQTMCFLISTTFKLRNDTLFGWSSGSPESTSLDTALYRNASGIVEVNNGTAGQYRDLVARSIYATNLYATNLIINGGATVTKILSATATLNFDLTALTVEDLTITVTGAADGDVVTLGVPNGSITTSVQYTAWVSAADTVTVRARTSAIGENPASGTFRATVIKH